METRKYGFKHFQPKPKTYWRFAIYILILIGFWMFFDNQRVASQGWEFSTQLDTQVHEMQMDAIYLDRINPYNY